ncbi:YegP family protein [Arthrobacter sp. 9MFCol3.1]|uniref:YegP family protein n=1 Tax=Arthrobacter sp. 9MFCol3.1 TaxID=1150398 RepID=UPI0005BD553F|nr:YegP family protein [Arthrobacter sp. 9MFCol3.1]
MTGMFELFTDSDTSYRFRLTAPDGTVMALSKPFPDLPSAVAGIAAVREYAGMGLVAEIPAPRDDAQLQSAASGTPMQPGAQRRGVHEAHVTSPRARARLARDGAPRSPEGPPRLRIPSAARFLGSRAVTRNQQMIVRWRQALVARTAQVGLGSC